MASCLRRACCTMLRSLWHSSCRIGAPTSIRSPRCLYVALLRGVISRRLRDKSERIRKLLVANRGEIACRVISTAKRLGIPTVAVFSAADRNARHVSLADEASYIGPAPAADSYLNATALVEAAKRHHVTAIHPGYGFLSEDHKFSEFCTREGFTFVGPKGAVIRTMGDKSAAKQIMRRADVPVVPGYDGPEQEISHLIHEGTENVGFPLLVKATFGGGGKGMKLVRGKDELEDAILSAQREALSSFGDSRVLLERFIERPRHVEVQIIADEHGNVLHLFERDCSVQRRHQKILEESPAPRITESFRQNICTSAVAAAKAVGYTNAGTVEFILDTNTNDYFFMEMNTRLQVEHPVTEGITGLDLVELQFLVASGKELPLQQEEIQQSGHCIEARLYAELPHQGFLPGAGCVERWQLPEKTVEFCVASNAEGTRVDSGVREGDEIGMFYDPMIAKIIAQGATRHQALLNLHRSLDKIQVCGLPTNLEFLKRVVLHPKFREADLSTTFIQQHETDLFSPLTLSAEILSLAAAVRAKMLQETYLTQLQSSVPPPWSSLSSGRLNHDYVQQLALSTAEGTLLDVTLRFVRGGGIVASVEGNAVHIERLSVQDNSFAAQVNGAQLRGQCCLFERTHDIGISLWTAASACTLYTPIPAFVTEQQSDKTSATITAPMHGKVTKVSVSEGFQVQQGDILIILEAMKMEHIIRAPICGTINQLSVHVGSNVQDGEILMRVNNNSVLS